MQSQGSAKTFTLYLGGIKAERRTRRDQRGQKYLPGPLRTSPKSRDLNLGKSADQMEKRLAPACPSRRRRTSAMARLLRHRRERAGGYAKHGCAMTAGLFDYIEKAFAE